MRTSVSSVPVGQDTSVVAPGSTNPLTRFLDLNKRFCRCRLQPRLYAVSHTEALDSWFRRRVKGRPDGTLLEFGCGRTFRLTQLLGERFARCYGTDIEDVGERDIPSGVVFERCTTEAIPFGGALFDCVVIRSVIEHVTDPAQTFAELSRVTKPGGRVLMNLPNKWDYVSMFARLAGPLKSWVLTRIVRMQFEDFPVAYRCNTRRAMYRFAARAGFEVEEFVPLPLPPAYLSFFVPLYVLGAIYQFVVSLCGLDALQPAFLVVLRKRDHVEASQS